MYNSRWFRPKPLRACLILVGHGGIGSVSKTLLDRFSLEESDNFREFWQGNGRIRLCLQLFQKLLHLRGMGFRSIAGSTAREASHVATPDACSRQIDSFTYHEPVQICHLANPPPPICPFFFTKMIGQKKYPAKCFLDFSPPLRTALLAISVLKQNAAHISTNAVCTNKSSVWSIFLR